MNIPHKIWTFWDSEQLPITVHNCIQTWKFLNPEYNIIVLNKKNLHMYIDTNIDKLQHSKDSPARFSDFVRANTLAKHGGIWIDASTICIQPLSIWLENVTNPTTEFVGFYSNEFTTRKRYPVLENWFFACIQGSFFMKLWRNEFMSSNKYKTMEEYIDNLEDVLKVDFQNIVKYDDIYYLAMHASAQKIFQIDKYPRKNIILFNAEEGPLKYRLHRKGHLSVEKRVDRLCKKYDFWAINPIIKFTGDDRRVMEKKKRIRRCVFNNVLLTIIKNSWNILE